MDHQRTSRRRFCATLGAGLLGLWGAACSGLANRGASRPNILMVTGDDLGVELGCYGDRRARTPHADALAARGVLFEHAYVTQASCSPSRGSIFTGLYPHQNGLWGLSHYDRYEMHRPYPTIPSLLRAGGYRTGAIGKIHIAPTDSLHWDWLDEDGQRDVRERDVREIARLSLDFMAEAGEQPFFCMVNLIDPHRPFHHQLKGLPKQPVTADDCRAFSWLGLDTPELREEMAGYRNSVARLDAGLGMLLEGLAERGLAENTLVVFLGDHGASFDRAKCSCYEAGIRIPLLVAGPGLPRGVRRDQFASTVDLLPTLCDAAGLASPQGLPGRSLLPACRRARGAGRDYLFAEYNSHHPKAWYPRRSVRDGRYKLILNLLGGERANPVLGVDGCRAWAISRREEYAGTEVRALYDRLHEPPRVELYDLREDPDELRNLAGRAELAETERRLTAALEAWRRETGDPLLDTERLRRETREHEELRA